MAEPKVVNRADDFLSQFDKLSEDLQAAMIGYVKSGGSPKTAAGMTIGAPTADYLDSMFPTLAPGVKFVNAPMADKPHVGAETSTNPTSPFVYMNTLYPGKMDITGSMGHEAGHVLAKRALGYKDYNAKFDELVGNTEDRSKMVQALLDNQKYLQEKYGIGPDVYFDRKKLKQSDYKNNMADVYNEQAATLGAIEILQNVDLTKDPQLRKTVFNTPEKRDAYNASVGYRQTQLDPRDRPSFTVIPEKTSAVEAIKDAWYSDKDRPPPQVVQKLIHDLLNR